ncbi:MAG: hypothetical protein GEV03_18730 [Streptosporangiales bacterium]|nr:hypothetical protein [Streptosporangiales bacterium]
MSVQMLRFTANKANVADIEAAVEVMVAAIQEAQPTGTRYALCKLPDGVTFVGFLELEDGMDNPLPGIAAAGEFQQNLKNWVVGEPPAPEQLEVVGSYKLFQ